MDRLNWAKDGGNWPNRHASRYVEAGALTWHVQQMGQGPALLLIHGTGASTHSWRALAPMLAEHFEVFAFDLPGHAFTSTPTPHLLTLPGMARATGQLLEKLNCAPTLIVGHSAGAAIAVRMRLDGLVAPRLIISLNGALLPFPGLARHVLPSLAKLIYTNSLVPRFLAWRAHEASAVQRLIEGTGSRIDPAGLALYARLFQSKTHVASTLSMMASWDLIALERDLPRLDVELVSITGGADRAIPAEEGLRAGRLVARSKAHFLRRLGHLAHEEAPREIADLIVAEAQNAGILSPSGHAQGDSRQ